MKAIRIDQTGGPEVLHLAIVGEPDPGAGEVRVRNHACGINFMDTQYRGGAYPITMPSGLGQEGAGVVEAVGAGVTRFKPGDRVAYCTGPIGAYAQSHVVKAERAVKLPDAVSFDTAAAALLKGMTARYLLRKTFRLEPGQAVVIHAAAGGVGQIAVQWAKHLGAQVIATAGSDEKARIVRDLGADDVIVSAREDIAARVREITHGEGAHVVYDSIGKDTWDASLDSLRPCGMLVSYGNASGPAPPISPLLLMQKGSLFLTRPTLASHTRSVEELDETAQDLFDVLIRGAVRIAPPTRYKLEGAAQAHRDLEARKTTGSLLLIP